VEQSAGEARLPRAQQQRRQQQRVAALDHDDAALGQIRRLQQGADFIAHQQHFVIRDSGALLRINLNNMHGRFCTLLISMTELII